MLSSRRPKGSCVFPTGLEPQGRQGGDAGNGDAAGEPHQHAGGGHSEGPQGHQWQGGAHRWWDRPAVGSPSLLVHKLLMRQASCGSSVISCTWKLPCDHVSSGCVQGICGEAGHWWGICCLFGGLTAGRPSPQWWCSWGLWFYGKRVHVSVRGVWAAFSHACDYVSMQGCQPAQVGREGAITPGW